MLDIKFEPLSSSITYRDKILMLGSCFSEEIGTRLQDIKFQVLQNPNGILYDPLSICSAITSWIENKPGNLNDLFLMNELWNSWQHHSRFSGTSKEEVGINISNAVAYAHKFIKEASWLFITPGTASNYELMESKLAVANCHKAPAAMFHKKMLEVSSIVSMFKRTLDQLFSFNPAIHVIFTVSPVRYLKDGLPQNNRSKGRLIESIHLLCEEYSNVNYFPAYELVIDVLRDHRFYSTDLVHPNAQAADFVFDQLIDHALSKTDMGILSEIRPLVMARKHRPLHTGTQGYQQFQKAQLLKAQALKILYPYIDLSEEIAFFGGD